jgi:hypothetical protein
MVLCGADHAPTVPCGQSTMLVLARAVNLLVDTLHDGVAP